MPENSDARHSSLLSNLRRRAETSWQRGCVLGRWIRKNPAWLTALSGWVVALVAVTSLYLTFWARESSLILSPVILDWIPDRVNQDGIHRYLDSGELACNFALINDGDFPEVFFGASVSFPFNRRSETGLIPDAPLEVPRPFVLKPGEVGMVELRYRLNLRSLWVDYEDGFGLESPPDSSVLLVRLRLSGVRDDGRPFHYSRVVSEFFGRGTGIKSSADQNESTRLLEVADYSQWAELEATEHLRDRKASESK